MANTVWGVVKDGIVMPHSPLPEGAHVKIHVCAVPLEVSPQLQEKLAAQQQAGANPLEFLEHLIQEIEHPPPSPQG